MKFILNTRTEWEEPPRARHQLAYALANKNHKVIFISKNKSGKPSLSKNKEEKKITVITPTWYIHGKYNMRIPLINEIYQYWIYKKLKARYNKYIVINFDHTASLLHRYFKKVIYFCNDNFLATKRSKSLIVSFYWFYKQRALIKKSLFCTGNCKYLYDYLLRYNNNSHLVHTAASNVHSEILKDRLKPKGNIINIVYVGWLEKLNIEWLDFLSEEKNYKIYLIGPGYHDKLGILKLKNNIIITGKLIGDDLKKIMVKSDVCVAPYYTDRDTEEIYSMPNKFWLYISFGKPIVTCEISGLPNLPEKFIYQSKNETEFVANIDKAILDNSISVIENRIKYIKKNTWANRVDELTSLFNKYAS